MKRQWWLWLAASFMGFGVGVARADVVLASHAGGTTDPETEGWVKTAVPTWGSGTLAVASNGYWFIYEVGSPPSAGTLYYSKNLSVHKVDWTKPWSVTARLSTTESYKPQCPAEIMIAVADGQSFWTLSVAGQTWQNSWRGISYLPSATNPGTKDGLGYVQLYDFAIWPGFNIYTMTYAPATDSVKYYLNGNLVGTLTRDLVPTSGDKKILWGDYLPGGAGGSTTGRTLWDYVIMTGSHPPMGTVITIR